jgi:hypothetical protein
LHMEASQHSLLAACFTLHSINATLAIVPQRGAGLWIVYVWKYRLVFRSSVRHPWKSAKGEPKKISNKLNDFSSQLTRIFICETSLRERFFITVCVTCSAIGLTCFIGQNIIYSFLYFQDTKPGEKKSHFELCKLSRGGRYATPSLLVCKCSAEWLRPSYLL